MKGGELPISTNDNCTNIDCINEKYKRNDFLKKCIPLYDMLLFDGNIVTPDGVYYIHHHPNNMSKNYILSPDLSLEKLSEKINIGNIKKDNFKMEDIEKYFNRVLLETIPCYFLYINYADVFNIFLSCANITSNDVFNTDIFRSLDSKFVGFSLAFNIFNLSFVTYTFFDILNLFISLFDNLNTVLPLHIKKQQRERQQIITTKLKGIYADKMSLCKIYDLAKYKKSISILPNTSQNPTRAKFLNSNFKCPTDDKYSEIVKKETHTYTSEEITTAYEKIIGELARQFIKIGETLLEFSKQIDFPNFKYIFLMSILSYRLANKYITGSWGFSILKTLDQLELNIKNEVKGIDNNKLSYFKKTDIFPLVYEYLLVSYKGQVYGNCMENVIWQFLKVLFWKNGKYDLKNIQQVMKDKYINDFKKFIDNAKDERSKDFVHDWVKFIMFEDNTNIKYDFIKTDVEINATLKNLFIVCKELFKSDEQSDENDESAIIKFFNDLIAKINLCVKTIEINSLPETDTIKLIAEGGESLNISLEHGRHAFFKEISGELHIINQVINTNDRQKIYDDLVKNEWYTASLIEYIALKIIFRNIANLNNPEQKYLEYAIKKEKKQKKILENLTSDRLVRIREELMVDVVNCKIFDNTKWHSGVQYIKSNEFWEAIVTKDDILKTWNTMNDNNDTVWHYANQYIKSDKFWETIVTKDDILKTWNTTDSINNTIWHYATKYIKSNEFWKTIVTKDDILKTWNTAGDNNNTIWHNAVQYIKSNEFWEITATKDDILQTWNTANDNNDTIWHNAVQYIKSNEFWEVIVTKDDILKTWDTTNNGNTTIWHNATEHIKSDKFWETIAGKQYIDDILNIWSSFHDYDENTVWYYAVRSIESDKFWETIAGNQHIDDILGAWSFQNYMGDTVWDVMRYNKSDKFWEMISKNDALFREFIKPGWDWNVENMGCN